MSNFKIGRLRWWMIGLLMVGSIINYLTRSTLEVAAPHNGQFAKGDKLAHLARGDSATALVNPEGWEKPTAVAEKPFRDQLAHHP